MPCIHNSIDMQGAAPSQAALQSSSQGQHPAALSQLAHTCGSANVAAAAHESASAVATASAPSVVVEAASFVTVEPGPIVATEPVPSISAEPAPVVVAEPSYPSIADPALPGAELTADGAAEPACLVAGSAAEEEAKEATGLTPVVNHMVDSTVRKGGPLCTETGLIDFGGVLQPCSTLVRLTDTSPFKLARIGNVVFDKFVDCCPNGCTPASYASVSDATNCQFCIALDVLERTLKRLNNNANVWGRSRRAGLDGMSGLLVVQGVSGTSGAHSLW